MTLAAPEPAVAILLCCSVLHRTERAAPTLIFPSPSFYSTFSGCLSAFQLRMPQDGFTNAVQGMQWVIQLLYNGLKQPQAVD